MKTWNVSGGVWASTYVGEIEAETGEEAIKKAYERAHVGVCHECAERISDPDISHLTAECGDEVVSDEGTHARDRIRELEAEIERMRTVVREMRDIAEHDCEYGDGCPPSATGHYVCVGCKARKALAALDNHPGLKP